MQSHCALCTSQDALDPSLLQQDNEEAIEEDDVYEQMDTSGLEVLGLPTKFGGQRGGEKVCSCSLSGQLFGAAN